MERVYGTSVAIGEHAVLLRGPSGSGKSDLALRLIDSGAALIADDWTQLQVEGDRLMASPPTALVGLLEVRGIGVVHVRHVSAVPLLLVVDLVDRPSVERHPSATETCLTGVVVPLFRLDPFEASAVAKVRLAVALAAGDIMRVP